MVWTIYQLKKRQHWPHTTTHSMTSSYLMARNLEQTHRARQEGVRLMRAAQTWKCWCKQTLIAWIRQRQDTEEANIGDLRKMIIDPSSDPRWRQHTSLQFRETPMGPFWRSGYQSKQRKGNICESNWTHSKNIQHFLKRKTLERLVKGKVVLEGGDK